MVSVPVVEKMHQGAGEKQKVGKETNDVCPMLGKQEEACDKQESNEHPFAAIG